LLAAWFTYVSLAFASAPAHAQVLLGSLLGGKLASPTFNMGFEVGINFSNLDGFSESERLNRTVFGLFADWRFSPNFHLGGAVLPFAGRGATGLAPVPVGDPEFDAQTAGGSMERSLRYVEIPVLLKWAPKRDEGFRMGAGPSLGIVTGATDRYEATTSAGTQYKLERDIADELPGLDVGVSVDVEWRFPMLAIAARYTQGLTDMRHPGRRTRSIRACSRHRPDLPREEARGSSDRSLTLNPAQRTAATPRNPEWPRRFSLRREAASPSG
jgi:hypothetical protein